MTDKNKIFFFLKAGISFGLLLLLLWIMRKNIGDIGVILARSNKLFFIIAFLINVPLLIGLSYRLKILMSGQKIFLPIKDFIYLTLVGYFFNNFLPTAIGGDIVKAHYASRKTNDRPASYAGIVVDRLLGFLSTLSLAVVGIVFMGRDLENNKIAWIIILMTAVLVFLIWFLLSDKKNIFIKMPFFEKLSKLCEAINFYRYKKRLLLKTYILALIMQAGAVMSIYFFIIALGGHINLMRLCLVIPLVWAMSMLPSLNGLGVREGAFVYFLKGDIGAEIAFSVSFLWLGVMITYSLAGGVMHLVYPFDIRKSL